MSALFSGCDPIIFYNAKVVDSAGNPLPDVKVDCVRPSRADRGYGEALRTDLAGCVSGGGIAFQLDCTFRKAGYETVRTSLKHGERRDWDYIVTLRPAGEAGSIEWVAAADLECPRE